MVDQYNHDNDENLAVVDICSITDERERNAIWQMQYFERWGHFPSSAMQSLYEKFLKDPCYKKAAEIAFNEASKIDERLKNLKFEDVINLATSDFVKKTAAEQAALFGLGRALNYLVARETVKASVASGVSASGRRMAIVAINQSASRAAA